MKILGEKSLSSKVYIALQVLFVIIVLADISVFGLVVLTILGQTSLNIMRENFTIDTITIAITTFFITGLIALYIICNFIEIFKNLKDSKLFEQTNSRYLKNISRSSILISIIYFILLITLEILLKVQYLTMGEEVLVKLLVLVFAVAFLIFGIGIKILNEIYKKAIEYKEENELTI